MTVIKYKNIKKALLSKDIRKCEKRLKLIQEATARRAKCLSLGAKNDAIVAPTQVLNQSGLGFFVLK
jgi:hypothetical protein